MSIQVTIMRGGVERKKDAENRWGMGCRGKGDGEMEMMGVVFSTHELRVGSLGSCAAKECCGGWEAFSIDLVPVTYSLHKHNPLPWFTITKG